MNTILQKLFSGSERSVTVKKNILGSLVVKGMSIIIQLMLVPMTLGYVSSELYGVWLTLSSVVLWFNFFDIGFTLGLKNKLAEAIALGDWDRGKALVSTTYVMMILIFVPLCIILELIAPHVDWCGILNVDAQYSEQIIGTMHVLIACFCLQMIVAVFNAVANAFQKTALAAAFPVTANGISLIFIYILTKCCEPSLISLAYAISTIPIIVISTASLFYFNGSFNKVSPSIWYFDKSHVRNLFSLGVKFFLIQIQMVVFYQSTNLLISNISGPNDVSCYNVAYKYLSIGLMIFTILMAPLWPAYTDAYVKKDYTWMKLVYLRMCKLLCVAALFTISLLVFSSQVYRLWIGYSLQIPFQLSTLLTVYMLLSMCSQLHVNIINGIGSLKVQTIVTLLGLFVHIPLSFAISEYYSFYGVLCSMILITFIYALVFFIQVNKILNNKACGIWIV